MTKTLQISASGVVLRGSGNKEQGGSSIKGNLGNVVAIAGGAKYQAEKTEWKFVSKYIPSGTSSFTLTDASGLKVGCERYLRLLPSLLLHLMYRFIIIGW